MIDVTFGVGCDVDVSPETSHGSVVVGTTGFLSLLETQLGLAGMNASFTRRLVQYHVCLQQTLTEQRFFYHSFQADPFSTAKALLLWRDELYQGGWQGSFNGQAPERLLDLADVEVFAHDKVDCGEGQRLQKVMATLSDQNVQIDTIELVDPIEHYPPLWQSLLNLLNDQKGIEIKEFNDPTVLAQAGSDLACLQAAVLSNQSQSEGFIKNTLQDDGSVVFLKANTVHLSSQYVAKAIRSRHHQDEGLQYTLLAEQNGSTLDASLAHDGLPRLGYYADSPWRPAFQLLPLVFEISWNPLNPLALLQFLSHPVNPLPARLRSSLSGVVASSPGIGSQQWLDSIREYLDDITTDDPKKSSMIEKDIDYWLHFERFDPEEGMHLDVAINRSGKLGAWLSARQAVVIETPEFELYCAASQQVEELIFALQHLQQAGMNVVNRSLLRHLIADVRGSGTGLVDRESETGSDYPAINRAQSPAVLLQPKDVVVWWDCQKTGSTIKQRWLPCERAALEQQGVTLWKDDYQLAQLAHTWLRPILSATKQLIIVEHAESEQHHPVMDLVYSLVDGGVHQSVEDLMLGNEVLSLVGKNIRTSHEPIELLPLPVKTRWWQLPEDISLPKRESESYSSLDKFIYSPYQWVLNYQARLRAGALSELSDNNRLKGSLAHRLFESFFTEHDDIGAAKIDDVSDWVMAHFDELLKKEGAVLLMPGRRSECEYFKQQSVLALKGLVEQLQAARVVQVLMEEPQEGSFVGGELNGSIDLLTINAEGVEAVIDIKWGGSKYRRDSLRQDDYLQLATYARLRKEKTGNWPELGYYLITEHLLLTTSLDYFPKGEQVVSESGESTAAYWKRAEQTWQWRWDQVERGLIEVTVSGTEPNIESQPGEYGLIIPESNDRYNDFSALTGWRDEQ